MTINSGKVCSVSDCDAPAFCRTWCRRHYTRWYETGSLDLGIRARGNYKEIRSIEDRFWPKVSIPVDKAQCWIWTGKKTLLGYGSIYEGPVTRRSVMAHRLSWEIANDRELLPTEVIDHLCLNPSCVNPAHLEPVSVAENTRRGIGPLRGGAFQLAKSHCPQGHPYDMANTHLTRRGARMCRTCLRLRARARRRAKREGVPYVDPFLLGGGG